MFAKKLVCFKCKKSYPVNFDIVECIECKGSLDIEFDYDKIKRVINKRDFLECQPGHWKYWMFYPIKNLSKIISLGEGSTPLIKSNLHNNLFFKLEQCNPTGSFKDRGSSIEISHALELNKRIIYCATTGNMGASVSAYAARAGMKTNIIIPCFAPKQKLKQIKAYSSKVKIIKGSYDDALKISKKLKQKNKKSFLAGDFPFRLEGTKSIAFELLDQFYFNPPDYIFTPVGNGILIYSIFKACYELKKVNLIKRIPKIIAVQSSNCAPIYNAWKKNSKEIKIIKNPKTIATAIACGNPINALPALYSIKSSNGFSLIVTDKEIIKAQKELSKQGIYAEFSGSVSFAGWKKAKVKGNSVCIITGHGLKE